MNSAAGAPWPVNATVLPFGEIAGFRAPPRPPRKMFSSVSGSAVSSGSCSCSGAVDVITPTKATHSMAVQSRSTTRRRFPSVEDLTTLPPLPSFPGHSTRGNRRSVRTGIIRGPVCPEHRRIRQAGPTSASPRSAPRDAAGSSRAPACPCRSGCRGCGNRVLARIASALEGPASFVSSATAQSDRSFSIPPRPVFTKDPPAVSLSSGDHCRASQTASAIPHIGSTCTP
jgi:hypothetical protein